MEKNYAYTCVGVLKFDSKFAGYKELLDVANEWKKDEHFCEIIIRKVSPDNWGLQFVYVNKDFQSDKKFNIMTDKYFPELKNKFGEKSIYAYDYNSNNTNPIEDKIIVLKSY